jgi:hypothetical protein
LHDTKDQTCASAIQSTRSRSSADSSPVPAFAGVSPIHVRPSTLLCADAHFWTNSATLNVEATAIVCVIGFGRCSCTSPQIHCAKRRCIVYGAYKIHVYVDDA